MHPHGPMEAEEAWDWTLRYLRDGKRGGSLGRCGSPEMARQRVLACLKSVPSTARGKIVKKGAWDPFTQDRPEIYTVALIEDGLIQWLTPEGRVLESAPNVSNGQVD